MSLWRSETKTSHYLLNCIPEDNMRCDWIGLWSPWDPAAEPRLVDRLIERGDLTESKRHQDPGPERNSVLWALRKRY